ncbi:hypothetical protein Hanom_Chr10g00878341 [Helianthus anomalus]
MTPYIKDESGEELEEDDLYLISLCFCRRQQIRYLLNLSSKLLFIFGIAVIQISIFFSTVKLVKCFGSINSICLCHLEQL